MPDSAETVPLAERCHCVDTEMQLPIETRHPLEAMQMLPVTAAQATNAGGWVWYN